MRRGGTVSISGVYGGAVDPMPMMQLFDKGIQMRMGQAHVKRWIDEIMPLVTTTTTRSAPRTSPPTTSRSTEAPEAYEIFQKKEDGDVQGRLQAVSGGTVLVTGASTGIGRATASRLGRSRASMGGPARPLDGGGAGAARARRS